MEDDKVIQLELEVERMRIDAAYESLKGMDRAEQLEKCGAFERQYPKYGKRLRERLGLVEPARRGLRRGLRRVSDGPKPQPEPPAEDEPKKAAIAKPRVNRVYGWDQVVIPKGVGEIEALTYVPGLVGQIVEWIVSGARRPNRVMALGVALGVVGTLIGRRVEGPTGNATHLYVFILAPTGWGKDWPLWCGNKLMIEVGAKSLLGPSEFVSGRGIIKYLKRNPLTLCIRCALSMNSANYSC